MSPAEKFTEEAWTWFFFAFCATLLRLLARLYSSKHNSHNGTANFVRRRRLQLDDWVMIMTFMVFTAEIICATTSTTAMIGLHAPPGPAGVPPWLPSPGSPPPNGNGTSTFPPPPPPPPNSNGTSAFPPPPPPPPPPSLRIRYLNSEFTSGQLKSTIFQMNASPAPIAAASYGAIMVMVVEQLQIGTIWLVKACLLTTHYKVTKDLYWQNLAVKAIAIYVAVGFVVMEVLYFGFWCRPFANYFPNPGFSATAPNPQCTKHTGHFIVNAVFNISSDVAILCVMLPLFARTKLPLREKLMLCGAFGLGGLVILWAALSKWWTLTHRFDSVWLLYYIRESVTAVIVANIPVILPLLRRVGRSVRESLNCSRSSACSARHNVKMSGEAIAHSSVSTGTTLFTPTSTHRDIDDVEMHFIDYQNMRKAAYLDASWDVEEDPAFPFRDHLKSEDHDKHYLNIVQSQRQFIAPWAEPPKSNHEIG